MSHQDPNSGQDDRPYPSPCMPVIHSSPWLTVSSLSKLSLNSTNSCQCCRVKQENELNKACVSWNAHWSSPAQISSSIHNPNMQAKSQISQVGNSMAPTSGPCGPRGWDLMLIRLHHVLFPFVCDTNLLRGTIGWVGRALNGPKPPNR